MCDDIPEHLSHVQMLLDIYNEERPDVKLKTSKFDSSEKLLKTIDAGTNYDLFLLDILMPKIDGITLAQKIRKRDKDVPLVFLTKSTDHALDAFGVYATQYILKPIKKDELFFVLDKITAVRKQRDGRFTLIAEAGRTISLLHSSIVAVEHTQRVLKFYMDDGNMVESKSIRTTFGAAITDLLKDSRFLLAHQSYAINMSHVYELRDRFFVMKNGMKITIPKVKQTTMKRAYLKYLTESIDTANGGKNQ